MSSVSSLQPAMEFTSPSPARIPSPEYIASRVQSIANYKLRLEASQNEPRLRKLLGHIFVYDAIREHQQTKAVVYTSPPAQRRREQQLRRRQMSESTRLAPIVPTTAEATSVTSTQNASDIKAYLAALPTPPAVPQSQAHDFAVFQHAIAAQLATLSQVRLEAASRQLYYMTQDDDDADEQAVEEYAESDDDNESDYDSYDGDDGDWRHENDFAFDWQPSNTADTDEHHGDSDTDPDSVNSAPPSPVTEEPPSPSSSSACHDVKAKYEHQGLTQSTGACYFLPLRPVPRRRESDATPLGF